MKTVDLGGNGTTHLHKTSISTVKSYGLRCLAFLEQQGDPGNKVDALFHKNALTTIEVFLDLFYFYGLEIPSFEDPLYCLHFEDSVVSFYRFLASRSLVHTVWHEAPTVAEQMQRFSQKYRRAPDVKQIRKYSEKYEASRREGPRFNWDSTIKYLKGKILSFVSLYTKQKMPEGNFGNPGYIFGGIIGQWLRSFMRLSSRELTYSLLQSLLCIKKGMPPMSQQAIKLAEEKTFLALTDPVDPYRIKFLDSWVRPERVADRKKTFKKEIVRTVEEVLWPIRKKIPDPQISFPSTSANYFNTRSKGGCVTSVLDALKELSAPGIPWTSYVDVVSDDISYIEMPNINDRSRSFLIDTVTEYLEKKGRGVFVQDRGLVALRCRLREHFGSIASQEEPLAVPVGLPEPFKVRVITKGSPNSYLYLKPIQKMLHDCIRQQEVFQLVGRPVERHDIISAGRYLYTVSGDYTSSTDNIYRWATKKCWKTICKELRLEDFTYRIGLKGLTDHIIEKADKSCKKPQQRGQLMGSILSFPILCILNAAVCRHAIEVGEEKTFSLLPSKQHRIPLRINGDDCLLSSKNPDIGDIHEYAAQSIGWELSPGKNSVSTEFCTLNSTMFMRKRGSWQHVPYFNMGLLRGLRKSGEEITDIYDLANNQREFVRRCPDWGQVRAARTFIITHFKKLVESGLPFYVPRCYGGLGLCGGSPSILDREICYVMQRKGFNLRRSSDAEWSMHQHVQAVLGKFQHYKMIAYRGSRNPECRLVSLTELEEDRCWFLEDQAYEKLIFCTLLHAKETGFGLASLINREGEFVAAKANRRLWNKAAKIHRKWKIEDGYIPSIDPWCDPPDSKGEVPCFWSIPLEESECNEIGLLDDFYVP